MVNAGTSRAGAPERKRYVASNASAETAMDLADRLREWMAWNDDAPATLCDLLARSAAALDQTARGEAMPEDDGKNGRQVTYKEVLATRGQRQRSDGTPLWPLRPDDFPGSYRDPSPTAHSPGISGGDDLPDWMR